jgi:hypothetical protein
LGSDRPSSEVPPISAAAWFVALDGQWIEAGARSWAVEVCGVHTDGRDWWIQVIPAGDLEGGLVLHVSGRATAGNALDALHRFSLGESPSSQIVHVEFSFPVELPVLWD